MNATCSDCKHFNAFSDAEGICEIYAKWGEAHTTRADKNACTCYEPVKPVPLGTLTWFPYRDGFKPPVAGARVIVRYVGAGVKKGEPPTPEFRVVKVPFDGALAAIEIPLPHGQSHKLNPTHYAYVNDI